MSAGWTSRVVFSGVAAAALAATAFAVAVNSHAQAPKHPEYHKTWQDGALRKPLKKGLKAKGSGERAKTQRGIIIVTDVTNPRPSKKSRNVKAKGGKAGN